jgi:phage terminase large subunit
MLRYKGYAKEHVTADCAEPKSIEEIRKAGIPRISPARKGKDSVINGIQFIRQFKLIVHPSCTNTILELNNYAWQSKNGLLVNEPTDAYNHLMDALRYAMERFTRTNVKVRAY